MSWRGTVNHSEIIAAARGWVGTPYRHQASVRGAGCDCLGLVRGVWRELLGAEPEAVPAYAAGWAEAGGEALLAGAERHLVPCTDIRGGEVLLFRWRAHLPAKHAGIAVSPDNMVHAQEDACVTEIYLSNWWRRHLVCAFRFPGLLPPP